MKKLHVVISHMLIIGLVYLISCSSPEITSKDQFEQKSLDEKIEVIDGTLVFETQEDMHAKLAELSFLSREEREEWENKMGFLSRLTLFHRVVDAEWAAKETYFAPYLEDMTEDEIVELNLPGPEHTPQYMEAVQKGIISVHEDSDTANTYTVNSLLSKSGIVDENGFVRIGNTLRQYLRYEIKHTTNPEVGKRELAAARVTDLQKQIYVLDLNSFSRASYSWGTPRYYYRWVTFDNNKKRAAYEIIGTSTDYGVSSPTQIDVVNEVGLYTQHKSFGSWTIGNKYRPYWTLNGTWNTRYGLFSGGHGCAISTTIDTQWPSNNAHSFSHFPPIRDYRFRDPRNKAFWIEWLYPNSQFNAPSGQTWCEPYRVTYIDFNVGVDGDGGGNHILGRHLYSE